LQRQERRSAQAADAHLRPPRLSFPEDAPPEERTVAGALVAEVLAGARSALVFENALIESALELDSRKIEVELCFRRCTFRGAVHFRETAFAYRVRFIECTFESDLKFIACKGTELWFVAEMDLTDAPVAQPGCVLRGAASFLDFKLSDNFVCEHARFYGEVSLNGSTVDGGVFMRSAEFSARAEFRALRVGYDVDATKANFLHATAPADFSEARIASNLFFNDAQFHGPAAFVATSVGRTLSCERTSFLSAEAQVILNSIEVQGFATFEQATFAGKADFTAAKIKGNLYMPKARFTHRGEAASFNTAHIGEHASLIETEFYGSIDFYAATIGATADFSKLKMLEEAAANFAALKVAEVASFAECLFTGPATFNEAHFGSLNASAAEFRNVSSAVSFSSCVVDFNASFAQAKFHGGANLELARIGAPLSLESAQFLGEGPVRMQSMQLANGAWLIGTTFHGPVSIAMSRIGGELRCERARFLNASASLEASSAEIQGTAAFSEAEFHGPVLCVQLSVGGDLLFDKACFVNESASLDLSLARIKRALELAQARLLGPTSFVAARIDGYFRADDAEFGARLDFNSTHIGGWALLKHARFARSVRMPYLRVASSLQLIGADFKEDLILSSASIGDSLLLHTEGEHVAKVGGSLDLGSTAVKANLRFTGLECRGRATLDRVTVGGEAQFNGAEFRDAVEFHSFAALGPVSFTAVRFHGSAGFEYFTAADSTFAGAKFAGNARFDNARIKGSLRFARIEFKGKVSLPGCVVEGDLSISGKALPDAPPGADCHQPLSADRLTVKGTLALDSARFAPKADVSLRLANIDIADINNCEFAGFTCFAAQMAKGLLFTRNIVGGEAHFAGVTVGGPAIFSGSRFGGVFDLSDAELLGAARFSAVDAESEGPDTPCAFDDNAKFEKTRFGGRAWFVGTRFGAKANFRSAEFKGEVEFGDLRDADAGKPLGLRFAKDANFDHVLFDAPVWFVGVEFGGLGVFSKTQFQNRVLFQNVHFTSASDRSASFAEADFQSQALFKHVEVNGWLTFYGAKSRHHLRIWTTCHVAGVVNLENASLALLEIEHEGEPVSDYGFLGGLTLAGCNYQRIQCPAALGLEKLWRALRANLERREQTRKALDFDRKPYLRFEEFCRSVGENELADRVYFDLRRREEQRESRWLHRGWAFFERMLFGYGVRPLRMLLWTIGFWVAGAVVFALAAGMRPALDPLFDAMRWSLFNLTPGISSIMKQDPRTGWLVIVALVQTVAGWALLALLAHRFFKGLKR
jgi:hypothetical protein